MSEDLTGPTWGRSTNSSFQHCEDSFSAGMAARAYNPSTWAVQTEPSRVQGQPEARISL